MTATVKLLGIFQAGDNLDGSDMNESLETTGTSQSKDELTDILSPHFNLESMVRESGLPNMDSKDVEEIFKGVLTDESQETPPGFTGNYFYFYFYMFQDCR